MALFRRTFALAVVFLVAKIALVLLKVADGRDGSLRSPWAPFALLSPDVVAVVLFAPIDAAAAFAARRRRIVDLVGWALYAAIVLWTALNVPVARVFGTPLTASMLAAAGGALKDSIAVYVTKGNVAALLAVVLAGVVAPRVVDRAPRGAWRYAVATALVLVALGPTAARKVETLGLHRNAAVALARTWIERARRAPDVSVAEAPIVPEGRALDLSHLSGAAKGRSFVWVVLESTGARYLAPYGAPRDAMPNLTRLAKSGVVFDAAYAVYPESIKGFYAALCSFAIAPHTAAERYAASKLPCTSIAKRFADAGYRTALLHSGRFIYLGMDAVVEGRGFHALEDATEIPAKHVSSFGVDDASTARRALSFVDGANGAPFFLVYMPIGGHHPYETPGEGPRPFPEISDYDRYTNDLHRSDHALGLLLDGLAQRGLLDKTVFVVNGDHGEAFHQHEGNFAHTLFVYEENVHVPLIVAAPGLFDRPLRAPQLASLLDVAPTMVDLAGLPVEPSWQGSSLLAGRPRVVRFFTDHAIFQLGLRDGRFKLIHEPETGRSRLFDLSVDPMETVDVSGAHGERVQRYRDHLLAWSQRQRALVAK